MRAMNRILKSFAVVILALAILPGVSEAKKRHVGHKADLKQEIRLDTSPFIVMRILHTNDIHGHVLPEPDVKSGITPPPMLGGAASLASAIREYRSERAYGRKPDVVLYFDAGDIFQGTPEGTLTRGEAMIDLFHMLNLDAMAAGNHDFDLGSGQLARLVSLARFPVLSANTIDEKTGQVALGMKSHVILDRGPLKIGVFGLITDEMPSLTTPSSREGCTFPLSVPAARQEVEILKDAGCDLIFGVTHAGTGIDTQIAAAVGIAAIVGGHSHSELSPHIRSDSTQTVLVSSGSYGRNLGVLDLLVHAKSHKVVQSNSRLIRLYASEFPPDPEVQTWAENLRARVGRALDTVLAVTDTFYLKSKYRECVIGNLVADAMRISTGADAAFMNNRGIRGNLPQGPVRLRDIFTIMPFDNTVTTMTLTGKEIKDLLEEGASLERDILHMSGVEMEVSYEKPQGRRVLKVSVGGKPLQRGKKYTVATNSFLAGGGDLFETFTRGKNRKDSGILLRDAIRDRVLEMSRRAGGTFSGQTEGRIKIVGRVPPNLKDDSDR